MRFLQCSDIHLDTPFAMLPPEKGEQRRREMCSGFAALLLDAAAQNIPLVLIPGDIFESNYVSKETINTVLDAMRRAKNCRIFIAPGNHDFLEERSPYLRYDFPENVHIFRSSQIEEVRIDEWNLSIYGCAGKPRPLDEAPLRNFRVRDESRLNIAVVHGHVAEHYAVPYAAISREDIANSGLDYAALGHVHTHTELCSYGNVCYAYSGCFEGRAFDETGEKGVLYGEITKDGCVIEFAKKAERALHIVEIDCQDEKDVKEQIEQKTAAIPASDLVRIELVGECGPEALPDPDALNKSFEKRFFHLEIWDKLTVEEEKGKSLEREEKEILHRALRLLSHPTSSAIIPEELSAMEEDVQRKKEDFEKSLVRYDEFVTEEREERRRMIREKMEENPKIKTLLSLSKEERDAYAEKLLQKEEKITKRLQGEGEPLTKADAAALSLLAKEATSKRRGALSPLVICCLLGALLSAIAATLTKIYPLFLLALGAAAVSLLAYLAGRVSPAEEALKSRCKRLHCEPDRAEEFAAFLIRLIDDREKIRAELALFCYVETEKEEAPLERHETKRAKPLKFSEYPAFCKDAWNAAASEFVGQKRRQKSEQLAAKLLEKRRK